MSEFSCIGDSTKLNKKKKDWRRAAVHIKTFTVFTALISEVKE